MELVAGVAHSPRRPFSLGQFLEFIPHALTNSNHIGKPRVYKHHARSPLVSTPLARRLHHAVYLRHAEQAAEALAQQRKLVGARLLEALLHEALEPGAGDREAA